MDRLSTLFKALSEESRLRILGLLLQSGELCVCDVQSTTGFTQTKVSRHLAYLKKAGLVREQRKGLWMLYAIASPADVDHETVLSMLAQIVRHHPKVEEDVARLRQNLSRGSCATVRVIAGIPEPHLTRIGADNGRQKTSPFKF